MLPGFNHNIMYKGEVFHVQTEDSGISNPHIITLLYRGGVILSSMKTSYADILKTESLTEVVAELMKEQHKEMMRRLKAGQFDERAFASQPPAHHAASEPETVDFLSAPSVHPTASPQADISLLFEMPTNPAPVQPQTSSVGKKPKSIVSLDDAILSFFGANE